MDLRELRVGNYILEKGSNSVTVVELNILRIMTYPEEFNPYTRIPLTEKWLLEFGFTEKYKSDYNGWIKNGVYLVDPERETGDLENKFYYNQNTEIKFVHQLQNLYFVLTGEELTVKL